MKITNIDTFIEEFRNGRNIWSRASIELAAREIKRLRKRIAELEQERRWIPVSERLPGKSGFYFLHICGTDGKKWERVGLFFVDGQFDVINDKVTHWQPLPNPPSEGE